MCTFDTRTRVHVHIESLTRCYGVLIDSSLRAEMAGTPTLVLQNHITYMYSPSALYVVSLCLAEVAVVYVGPLITSSTMHADL